MPIDHLDPDHSHPTTETEQSDIQAAYRLGVNSSIEKNWWKSKTILAAIAAMLPPLAHVAGLDYAAVAPYSGDIMTIVGAVLAIYGRRAAVTIIK